MEKFIINSKTGKKYKNLIGERTGFVEVVGLVENWEDLDGAIDRIWVLRCHKHNIETTRNSQAVRCLRRYSDSELTSGILWDEYKPSLIGKVYPGSTLRVLEYNADDRHGMFLVYCETYKYSRWISFKNLQRVKTLKHDRAARPEGLLLDAAVDELIGLKAVTVKNLKSMSDGRELLYYSANVDGRNHRIHRLAYEVMTGEKLGADDEIHHINHNTLDNRIENLMKFKKGGEASCNVQSQHKRMRTSRGHAPSSKYVGVYHVKNGRWGASIGYRGKQIVIGTGFKSEEEALEARTRKIAELNEVAGTAYITQSEIDSLAA